MGLHVYQSTDTMYPLLLQMARFALSDILHSYCTNSVNVSTVVMLVFWLCQFNTGSLACGCVCHCRLSFFVWFYEGLSNENLKSVIKIRNTARLSCKLTTVILMD